LNVQAPATIVEVICHDYSPLLYTIWLHIY
jgi:hypothetical protein